MFSKVFLNSRLKKSRPLLRLFGGVGLALMAGIVCAQQAASGTRLQREAPWPRIRMSHDISGGPLQLAAAAAPAAAESLAVASPAAGSRSAPGLSHLAVQTLLNQPAVRAAAARVAADDERLLQARALLRPSASGSAGYQKEFARQGTTIPARTQSGGVQGSLPLLRPQAYPGIDAAQFQLESTRAQSAETETELLATLATTYFAAVQQVTETTTLVAERELLLTQRQVNERRVQGGIGTLVEVLETAARADLLTGQVRGAEGAEKTLFAELSRLALVPVGAVRPMKDESPALLVPPQVQGALDLARAQSPTLLRLRKTLESARANVSAQRGAHWPTIDLVANLDRSRTLFDGGSSLAPSTGIGVRMNVPLYEGGATQSRVREAHAQGLQSEEALREAENALQSDLIKAYADLEKAQLQLAANVGGLGIARAALEATVKAFTAGARSNIDVLNAQQQTFSAQREVARSRAAIQVAQTRILALMGTLNLDAVARLSRSLVGD